MESYLDLVPSSPHARTPSDVGIYYINQVKRHFKKRVGHIPRVKLTNDELEKYTRAFAALAELADKIDAHLPRLFALMERHLLDELVTIITAVSAQRQRALYSRRKRTYILTYADVVDYTTTLRSVSQRFSTVIERTPFANPDRILPRQLRSNAANAREPQNAVAGPSRHSNASDDSPQPTSLADSATTRAAARLRRATIPGSSIPTPSPLPSTTSPLLNPTRRWSYDAAVHGTLKQGSSSKRPLEARSPSSPTFTSPSQKKMRRRTWPTSSAEDVSHHSTTEFPKSKGKVRMDPPPVPPKAADAWKPGMPADALRRRMKRRGTMDSLRAAFDEDEYILRSIPEPKFPVFPSPTPLLAQKRPGAPHTLAKPNIASKALWMISASESTDSLVPMVDANDTPEMPSPPASPVSCVHRSDDDVSLFDEPYADRRSSRTSIPSTDPEVIGITDPYPKIADDGDWLEFNLPISGLAEKWVEKVPEPPRLEVSAEPTQIWWKMVLKTASSVFPTLPRHS